MPLPLIYLLTMNQRKCPSGTSSVTTLYFKLMTISPIRQITAPASLFHVSAS